MDAQTAARPSLGRRAMIKTLFNVLIAFLVAFVTSGGLAFVARSRGADAGMLPLLLGSIISVFTFFVLNRLQGTYRGMAADAASRARALTLLAPVGHSVIYLVRTGFAGKAIGVNVAVDGKAVVQLKSPGFTCIEVATGNHIVEAEFAASTTAARLSPATLTISCTAGGVAILHLGTKMGLAKGRIVIERWPLDEARRKLPGIKMIAAIAAPV